MLHQVVLNITLTFLVLLFSEDSDVTWLNPDGVKSGNAGLQHLCFVPVWCL